MSKDFNDIHKHSFRMQICRITLDQNQKRLTNFNLILSYTFSNKLVLQIMNCYLKTNRQWQNQLVSKITVFWDVTPCTLVLEHILKMEDADSSETLVCIYQITWCNILEDSNSDTAMEISNLTELMSVFQNSLS